MSDPILELPYTRVAVLDEDGSYFAEIEEFPGCFATGATEAEALATLEDVAESWLMACRAQGQHIPPPKQH